MIQTKKIKCTYCYLRLFPNEFQFNLREFLSNIKRFRYFIRNNFLKFNIRPNAFNFYCHYETVKKHGIEHF